MSTESQQDRERALERLFAHAKPREAPPAADEAFIRAALYAEWDALTARRARVRRFARGAAAAAVAAVVVALSASLYRAPEAPEVVAGIERVAGVVALVGGDGQAIEAAPGASVDAGTVVTTAGGQVSLRLTGRGSLRLAADTRVRLVGAREVELGAGLLYYDSEGNAAALSIATARGTVRDIGTQFFTRVLDERLEVGVRDGRVAVALGGERSEVTSGQKLTVPEGGAPRREPLATFGDEWAWVERLAPPFAIDGRTVGELLTWVADQTGREVVFQDPAAERLARTSVLRGSIDLEPLPKLAAVLATTDLEYSIDEGTILVRAH